MTTPFWIGTGWKMNKTQAQARAYIARLQSLLPAARADVALFILPPFTALAAAREAVDACPDTRLLLGAQNMHWAENGAHTGEISAEMLKEFAVDLVEIGHCERRAACGETDETVNLKVKAALSHGLRPLVCVGDSAREYRAGASLESIVRQVKLAFCGIDAHDLGRCLLAYEPAWAIGEQGSAADPAFVAQAHRAMRLALAERSAARIAILYGGSVHPENALAFSREEQIDGLFIGRAAWTAEGLAQLIDTSIAQRQACGLLP